jgi:FSR family fosmidomycin resistance protein-like MFS transporter
VRSLRPVVSSVSGGRPPFVPGRLANRASACLPGPRITGLFLPPAALVCFVLLRKHRREIGHGFATQRTGRDRWGPFAVLTGIEALRSVAFFALNTFIELYWIRYARLPAEPAGNGGRVTLGLGLGVSVGGLAAPLLALIADNHGPRGSVLALLVVPPLALLCGLLLRDPGPAG